MRNPDQSEPTEAQNYDVIREGNCEVINLSGQEWEWQVKPQYPKELWEVATKLVVMPDFCEGKSIIPTGSTITIDTIKCPEWRKYAVGDVGCGMQWMSTQITYDQFMNNLDLWDEVAQRLKQNAGKFGDLGSGNHFLDAVVSGEHGFVNFLVHTGSRNESGIVDDLIDKPEVFDEKYAAASVWAKKNRDAVIQVIQEVYGPIFETPFTVQFDNAHNLFHHDGDEVTIYKGANRLLPGQLSVIPSSMTGSMQLIEGTQALESVNFALLHGTGRRMSRGEAKEILHEKATPEGEYDFSEFRLSEKPQSDEEKREAWREHKIYVPSTISNRSIGTEYPGAYRSLSESVSKVGRLIKTINIFRPIAYIGQL